jgi:hypothetical protein
VTLPLSRVGAFGDVDDRTKALLTMATLVLVGGQADAAVALAAGAVAISRDDYIDLRARMLVDAAGAARVASANGAGGRGIR